MTKTTRPSRPFSPGMSTSPAPTPAESRPSPWLTMAVPIAISLLGVAVQWGTLGSDVRHLERRASVTEAEVARVSTAQSAAATQYARIEARIEARFDGMSADIARLTRAVERFTDGRPTTARDIR